MKLNNFLSDKRTFAPADEPVSAPPADDTPPVAVDTPPEPTPPSEAPAAPDYNWLPEDYRKDGNPDFDAFRAHYDDEAGVTG